MKPDLSVIILSFNTMDLTRACLISLKKSSLGRISMEILVCDNGSSDGSVGMIRKEFPDIILIENTRNLGFAAGNNPGIRKAKGNYILLLNSDTEVQRTSLSVMLDYMRHHKEVGAATCKLVLANGSIDPACHRGFPSPWAAFTYFSKLERIFPKTALFGQYHQTYKDFNTVHEIDMISGAFFLTRSEVIQKVGMLDEEYYFYGEDMDWCFRIKEKGWKIIYNPKAIVLQKKKQSGRAHSDRMRRVKTELYFYEYNKLFYRKNYGRRYPGILMSVIYLLFDLRILILKHLSV